MTPVTLIQIEPERLIAGRYLYEIIIQQGTHMINTIFDRNPDRALQRAIEFCNREELPIESVEI